MQPDISATENSDFLLSLPTVRILASFAVIIRTTNRHVCVSKNSIKFYSFFFNTYFTLRAIHVSNNTAITVKQPAPKILQAAKSVQFAISTNASTMAG